MEPVFDFKILSHAPFSRICKAHNIKYFSTLCNYIRQLPYGIRQLPYGRIQNRTNFSSIIKAQKGTCSTKHAFIKAVAQENNQESVVLYLGIYKMNESNTKGVGAILDANNLEYIPEAHIYLKINGTILDVTRTTISKTFFNSTLLIETKIEPNQIGMFKVNHHKAYLKQWLIRENISYSLKEIWKIREVCIAALV